jgi:HTH-type transcriptional regulator / antitoxin HigA
MDLKPIRTEADHKAALAEIDRLWNAQSGTAEGDLLEVLVVLVDAYERKHHPIALPDPLEAILFRLEQSGQTRKDLEPILGSRGRVSEVLSGARKLTLPMIRGLNRELQIPAEVLIAERTKSRAPKSRKAKSGKSARVSRRGEKRASTKPKTKQTRGSGSRPGGRSVALAKG